MRGREVPFYIGANPELFEDYLNRQDAVLGELLNRYAEPSLARERSPVQREASTRRGSEGGRVRRAA